MKTGVRISKCGIVALLNLNIGIALEWGRRAIPVTGHGGP
jgi:hypothetical protein